MSDPRWDWLDSATGIVVGIASAFAGLLGWLNRRFVAVHERIDKVEDLTQDNNIGIKVQQAHHEANLIRLSRIEQQNSAQLDILQELVRRK